MAINNPIVAAGGTITRGRAKVVTGKLSGTVPPNDDPVVVDGVLTYTDQTPQREGQTLFVLDPTGRAASIFIVIEIQPGTLEWRRAFPSGETTDPRTGQAKDPLYGLY